MSEDDRRIVCPRCGQKLRLDDDKQPHFEPGTEPLREPPPDPRVDKGA